MTGARESASLGRVVRAIRNVVTVGFLLVGLVACDSGPRTNGGLDGSASGACASLGECDCMAATDRCTPRTEACWCPSICDPNVSCVCGGGRFLGCQDNDLVAVCTGWLTEVQAKCAGRIPDIGTLCSDAPNPFCVAQCLANLKSSGMCSEIDCRFCPTCDCDPPTATSPFADCVAACVTQPPPA